MAGVSIAEISWRQSQCSDAVTAALTDRITVTPVLNCDKRFTISQSPLLTQYR